MSTKQTTKYKVGQTVRGVKGSRTITDIKGKTIKWKNKKRDGKCTLTSFQSWKAGRQ